MNDKRTLKGDRKRKKKEIKTREREKKKKENQKIKNEMDINRYHVCIYVKSRILLVLTIAPRIIGAQHFPIVGNNGNRELGSIDVRSERGLQ